MASSREPDPVSLSPPRTPRWVTVFGIVAGALFLVVLYDVATGGGSGHGPGRHGSPVAAQGHTALGRLLLLGALFLTAVALNWGWLADRGLVPVRRARLSAGRLWSWQPMPPRLRKFVLTVHVTTSVGWLGAVLAYLALDITAVTGRDVQTVRAAYLGMELVIWYAIVPLAAASVVVGVANALGTPWGLTRHYWVVVKFLLTILATFVLLQEVQVVSDLADAAAAIPNPRALPGTLLHSGGGLLVLLVIAVLAVFKPRGTTSGPPS